MLSPVKNWWKRVDLDDLLGYDTFKVVHVRDRRLGFTFHGFQIAIFAYIIYSVIHNQLYLKKESPVPGAIRVSLLEPTGELQTSPYCQQKPCVFWGANQILYDPGDQGATFLTTRISTKVFPAREGCDFQLPTNAACRYNLQPSTVSPEYYITDLDRYTLMIEHSVRGTATGISIRNGEMSGRLLITKANNPYYQNETELHFSPQTRPPRVPGDIITVGQLLRASGAVLDAPSDAPGADQSKGETYRSSGIVLSVVIEYDNDGSTNFKYSYSANYIKGNEFKVEETIFNPTDGSITELNRHGIRIVFSQTGNIGKFDFMSLLTNLVASIALLKTATLLVEIFMLKFLPQRKMYYEAKYELTEDFDDLRKRRNGEDIDLEGRKKPTTLGPGVEVTQPSPCHTHFSAEPLVEHRDDHVGPSKAV
ncbi:hypothetical protein K493DRAFT_412410 [Basidiobolus meristosporus CBS 931.73]|uniref:P2X purinoceptor n=1 Tax=Basidiobolus meristosporus CBS 931.73 TaxID=1314790 RepID=A0A1Y1WWU1_9FUNG|nr:hypothetical protein K493DRAFT_412410 [Basidiobolus meristosporus CBS 931.73]|eukprot:ORX77973.1 hypothetical protein K493DRAFT_412410 [Basidiobolus meristosporus CBS 931.73]